MAYDDPMLSHELYLHRYLAFLLLYLLIIEKIFSRTIVVFRDNLITESLGFKWISGSDEYMCFIIQVYLVTFSLRLVTSFFCLVFAKYFVCGTIYTFTNDSAYVVSYLLLFVCMI